GRPASGRGPDWLGLGDRATAPRVVRARRLAAGCPLSAISEALCDGWRPGVRLLPMTADPGETHVVVADEKGRRAIHFQEWWVRYRAQIPAESFVSVGADSAKPAPGVLSAIDEADFVLFPPSNPVVSIGSILGIPGIRDAVAA